MDVILPTSWLSYLSKKRGALPTENVLSQQMTGSPPLVMAVLLRLQSLAALHAETSIAAREAIPFASLSETNRVLVRSVTDHYTLRRPAAKQTFAGQKARFEWMLDHLHPTVAHQHFLDTWEAVFMLPPPAAIDVPERGS